MPKETIAPNAPYAMSRYRKACPYALNAKRHSGIQRHYKLGNYNRRSSNCERRLERLESMQRRKRGRNAGTTKVAVAS